MDLIETSSVQSLLDSDLESVESLQCLDIEELDEVEYALPASEAPTLAEALLADDGAEKASGHSTQESASCSTLQVEFLQGVSQQLTQAQERSAAGAATALSVSSGGKLTVGTAHGHILSFQDQVLRWVCNSFSDRGAVSCLSYNQSGDRLLVGFARGLLCQYEATKGSVLRSVTLGGETWGILRVTWAGSSGVALDTGGSVWLIKFSRPLGVRSARASCLFSGARGEVVALAARDARVLALGTLARVVVVAGGRAAAARLPSLPGPAAPHTLPALAWCETDERLLVCARADALHWLCVQLTGAAISVKPVRCFELKAVPLWLGWVGGGLAIFDVDENLRLWGEDYDNALDLSHVEPVYASAFFKGLWTDGMVSRAMVAAGGGALGGACACGGSLALLGRRGVVRVRARDRLARARALLAAARHAPAVRLLAAAAGPEARPLAQDVLADLAERPSLLRDKKVADEVVRLCVKLELTEEMWSTLWERCSQEGAFVEAIGDAIVRGELTGCSPDCTQALIEQLAQLEPALVERVVSALPLSSLDPHRATVFTRDRGLWRAAGAVAAALGGASGAMRSLTAHVSAGCGGAGAACRCAGDALLLAAADGLAGRGVAGRALPDHQRPSARHDALQTLLSEESAGGSVSAAPLCVLARHDARATVRLLEQGWRAPPFAGPLGKQNRLRVARALAEYAAELPDEDRIEILEFITSQVESGSLPAESSLVSSAASAALAGGGERVERALAALHRRAPHALPDRAARLPRLAWRIAAAARDHRNTLHHFFQIERPSEKDLDELFEHLRVHSKDMADELHPHLPSLVRLRPRAVAALLADNAPDELLVSLLSDADESAFTFAECSLEMGALQGNAVAAYLTTLCKHSPTKVKPFLLAHPGAARPEDALKIVREHGPREAEPVCLEANGDSDGALEVLIELMDSCEDEDKRKDLVEEACALCSRASATVPRAAAAALWLRLAGAAGRLPAGGALAALAYCPPGALVAQCGAPATALRLVRGGAQECALWQCAARQQRREAAARAERALRAGGRGVAARAHCASCGERLAAGGGAARVSACAHRVLGAHAACPTPAPACALCPRDCTPRCLTLPQRAARRDSPPWQHDLSIVAPPRPDLEGII